MKGNRFVVHRLISHLITLPVFVLSSCYLTPVHHQGLPFRIQSMDARGAAFNNVGRDQINADQVIINPNSLGALGKTILELLHAHFP